MYSTDGLAAICIATVLASLPNTSPAATKSVSQLTSSSTPRREPGWMYDTSAPSAASRPAFLSALARPFLRSHSLAVCVVRLVCVCVRVCVWGGGGGGLGEGF
jgi:hypothetical protein